MASKSDYYWYKEHRICPHCSKARAKEGRVFCEKCLEKDRKRKAEDRRLNKTPIEKYRIIKKNSYNKLMERRKANNLCVRCGKPRTNSQRQHCDECLAKFRKYNKERYMKKTVEKFKND